MRKKFKIDIKLSLLWLSIIAAIILVDYFTKQWAIQHVQGLPVNQGFSLINLVYMENSGMAWGMLQTNTVLITVCAFLGIGTAIALLILFSRKKMFSASLTLIIGGGIGNLIERINIGHVTDFIQFGFWKSFPVFNVADIAITVGTLFLIIYILFSHDDDEQNIAKQKEVEL